MFVSDKALDRAWRAQRAMRDMLPILTGFATALAGRPIKVIIDDGTPRTNGRVVYMRPPIELGDTYEHNRLFCLHRDDESSHMLCPACEQMDQVWSVMFHEIAHIIFGSFEAMTDEEKARYIDRAIAEMGRGAKATSRIAKLMQVENRITKKGYMVGATLISPFLPKIVNALEDARVNRRMYQARAGTYHMFRAHVMDVFNSGIEKDDGTVFRWHEAGKNMQVIVGLFCKASNFDYSTWFSPEVVEALDDEELTELLDGIADATGIEFTYKIAFPALECVRKYGFCKRREDIKDDPAPPPDPEPEEDQDDEPDEEEASQDDDTSKPDVSEPCDEDGDASDDDDEDEAEGEESPDAGDDHQDSEAGDPGDHEDPEQGDDDPSEGDDHDDGDDMEGADDDSPGAGDDESEGADDEAADDDGLRDGDVEDDDDLQPEADGEADGDSEELGGMDDPDEDSGDEATSEDGDDGADPFGDDSDSDEGDDDATDEAPGTEDDDLAPFFDDEGPGDGGAAGGDSGVPEDDDPYYNEDEDDESGPGLDLSDPDEDDYDDDEDLDAIDDALKKFGDHEDPDEDPIEKAEEEEAITQAIRQANFFDQPSRDVVGVNVFTNQDENEERWRKWVKFLVKPSPDVLAAAEPPDGLLSQTVLKARKTFAENAKARRQPGFRSGRVNSNRLASVRTGNREVFTRTSNPGKRDYFVSVTMDVSGSQAWDNRPGANKYSSKEPNIKITREIGLAIGDLLSRVGVPFAMHAHTGMTTRDYAPDWYLDLLRVKGETDQWTDDCRMTVARLQPVQGNLDGHTLEWQRKLVERHSATDRIILYVTDGEMPAANYQEELEILRREIATCRRLGIHLLGVGVRTDSPKEHGLDTVQLDTCEDLPLLIKELERRLVKG